MAITDSNRILNELGFDNPITLVKGTSTVIVSGLTPVHHLVFSTDGQPVNSKNAHVTVSEMSLNAKGFVCRNTKGEIWLKDVLISFADSTGTIKNYIVKENFADETLGVITLILGSYVN